MPTIFIYVFFAMTFLAFYPSKFYLPIFSTIGLLFWGIAIIILIRSKIRPSIFILLLALFQFWQVISTFINKGFDSTILLSAFRMIIFFYSADALIKKNNMAVVNVIFKCSFLFVILDILSIYLYPNGLQNSISTDTNIYIEEQKSWLLGIKNNRIYWYLLSLMPLYIKAYYNQKIFKVIMLIYIGISLITLYKIGADTSFVVMLIASLSIIFNNFSIKLSKQKIQKLFYLILILSSILVTSGLAFLLTDIGELFGKDATLSGRTYIWAMVINDLLNSPIIGRGYISGQEAITLMGNYAFVNAHNQWLQTFWQGGIVLLFIFISFFITIVNHLCKCLDGRLRTTFFVFIVSLLIEMSMEVIFSNYSCWTIMFMIYYAKSFSLDKNHYRLYKKSLNNP